MTKKKKLSFYHDGDFEREVLIDESDAEPYRSPFRRDFARIIHCPAWRRLQRKTQLFPGDESDFFRNRLTHSLEVAQIAKSIALRLNHQLNTVHNYDTDGIDLDLVEIAALAHDIGHPPFGHTGEAALDKQMSRHGGFEGNAQTLRIVTRLEKRQTEPGTDVDAFEEFENGVDLRRGLNLCSRSIAALLKYDSRIAVDRGDNPKLAKGYYASEEELIERIKNCVLLDPEKWNESEPFRTIEMQIMDIADDIAYSTYDLEDALKAGFTSPLDLISQITENEDLRNNVATKIFKDRFEREYQNGNPADVEELKQIKIDCQEVIIDVMGELLKEMGDFTEFEAHGVRIHDLLNDEEQKPYAISLIAMRLQKLSQAVSENGYLRSRFTSFLVSKSLRAIDVRVDEANPSLSELVIPKRTRLEIDVFKHMTFELHIKSPRLRLLERRGSQVVEELFDCFKKDIDGSLLPIDWRKRLQQTQTCPEPEKMRMRLICDYISGMTDAYALDMYARLKSANPSILFRPT